MVASHALEHRANNVIPNMFEELVGQDRPELMEVSCEGQGRGEVTLLLDVPCGTGTTWPNLRVGSWCLNRFTASNLSMFGFPFLAKLSALCST